jgi:peptidoglycan/xylan/chitin deacetylase (PgdA/CDA1 family)
MQDSERQDGALTTGLPGDETSASQPDGVPSLSEMNGSRSDSKPADPEPAARDDAEQTAPALASASASLSASSSTQAQRKRWPARRGLLIRAAACSLLLVALLAAAAAPWLHAGASPTPAQAATPTVPIPPTATASTTAVSPQGCLNEDVPPTPVPLKLYTTASYPGVRGEVALTFDDGPSPSYTLPILDALQAAGAHATFFVVGRHAQRYPEVVRAEWQAGDAIGNHTWGHDWIAGLPRAQLQKSLTATTTAIRAATGDPCVWLFRPPWGGVDWNRTVAAEVRREGLTSLTWDLMAMDWTRPGASTIARRIIQGLHPGAIILLHDGAPDTENQDRSQTVAALPAILAAIQARGLRAVTLPQLLADAGLAKAAPPQRVPTPSVPTPRLRANSPPAAILVPDAARSGAGSVCCDIAPDTTLSQTQGQQSPQPGCTTYRLGALAPPR